MKAWVRAALLASLVLTGALGGCATTSNYEAKVRSWDGKSASDLVVNWGNPDAIEKLSSGNRMYVYARLHRYPVAYNQARRNLASVEPSSSVKNPTATASRAPASSVYIECATYFEVDPQNTIVSTLFRGDDCKSRD